jgi:hypothetical protein
MGGREDKRERGREVLFCSISQDLAKKGAVHAQSFDVACTHDHFWHFPLQDLGNLFAQLFLQQAVQNPVWFRTLL